MIEVRRLIVLLILLLVLGAGSYSYIQSLSDEAVRLALSEDGYFEQLSLVFWALLSAFIIWRWWPGSWQSWAVAMLPLIAMAREASLHKAIYGISVLKRKFYLSPDIPLMSKLLLGCIVLILLSALLYGLYLSVLWLKDGAWKRSSGQFLLAGLGLLIGTKVLDRMNAVLRKDFGIILPPHFAESVAVFEESFEMALPLVLLAAARYVWLENKKT
ncbi:MAG: hypothetical protein U0998_00100 [Moraxellaceae bacterium]|nr:hypothetical protein [Moraxellaceae bacterium]MDZ4385604.1 hypothetical protein [Moraxellaceae bacterium]